MEDFNSETDSDYTSYWRDWVSATWFCSVQLCVSSHSSFFRRRVYGPSHISLFLVLSFHDSYI